MTNLEITKKTVYVTTILLLNVTTILLKNASYADKNCFEKKFTFTYAEISTNELYTNKLVTPIGKNILIRVYEYVTKIALNSYIYILQKLRKEIMYKYTCDKNDAEKICICRIESLIIVECSTITIESM